MDFIKRQSCYTNITQARLCLGRYHTESYKIAKERAVRDADYDRFATVILEEILFAFDNVDALSLNDRDIKNVLSCFDKIIYRESCLKMDELRDNGSAVSESNDAFTKLCIDQPYVTIRTKDLLDMTKINTSVEKISNWVKQETILRTSWL
jgi:hypothetical protein